MISPYLSFPQSLIARRKDECSRNPVVPFPLPSALNKQEIPRQCLKRSEVALTRPYILAPNLQTLLLSLSLFFSFFSGRRSEEEEEDGRVVPPYLLRRSKKIKIPKTKRMGESQRHTLGAAIEHSNLRLSYAAPLCTHGRMEMKEGETLFFLSFRSSSQSTDHASL